MVRFYFAWIIGVFFKFEKFGIKIKKIMAIFKRKFINNQNKTIQFKFYWYKNHLEILYFSSSNTKRIIDDRSASSNDWIVQYWAKSGLMLAQASKNVFRFEFAPKVWKIEELMSFSLIVPGRMTFK